MLNLATMWQSNIRVFKALEAPSLKIQLFVGSRDVCKPVPNVSIIVAVTYVKVLESIKHLINSFPFRINH